MDFFSSQVPKAITRIGTITREREIKKKVRKQREIRQRETGVRTCSTQFGRWLRKKPTLTLANLLSPAAQSTTLL